MDKTGLPDRNVIRHEYDKLLPARNLVVRELETYIENVVMGLASRLRVKGRVKSFGSYFKKQLRLMKHCPSSNQPLITDLIGIRIICPFLEDLAAVEELIKEHCKVIEVERKGGDHTFREFGYESIHLLINIPGDILKKCKVSSVETAEIQIRTILQDAWAEVEHELVYKAEFTPFDDPMKRKLAAVNASLSLADIIFQEIRSYQRELNGELGKRRDSFFKKVEESTDAIILSGERAEKDLLPQPSYSTPSNVSIDELLLDALYAHNKNQFDRAITIYTQILDMNPNEAVRSLIHKHRGMANFARSHYDDAIADFSESFRLDKSSYKTAYYEGVVWSVLLRYPQALNAYNRSLEINPFQPYCLFRRGQAYYHLEDYPQALGDCEAALALESFEAARKFRDLLLTKLKM